MNDETVLGHDYGDGYMNLPKLIKPYTKSKYKDEYQKQKICFV